MTPPVTLASLPMYDWTELTAQTDAWWAGIAGHLRDQGLKDVPSRLTRSEDPGKDWSSPDLLFSQTCGLPLVNGFFDRLSLLAVPVYGVEGCGRGTYSSALVVQRTCRAVELGDIQGMRAVCNAPDSMSGMLALAVMAAPLAPGGRVFDQVHWSGSHRQSVIDVAADAADIAAIDAVSWALAQRLMPDATKQLRVLAWSPQVPCLPYVTSSVRSKADVAVLQEALKRASFDPRLAAARLSLLIEDVEFIAPGAYDVITTLKTSLPVQFYHNEFGFHD